MSLVSEKKFRVWDNKNKIMIYNGIDSIIDDILYKNLYLSFNNKIVGILNIPDANKVNISIESDRFTPMQYIGKDDTAKRPIYELDNVHIIAEDSSHSVHRLKGTVIWDYEDCAYYVTCPGSFFPMVPMRLVRHIKVIGNYYQGDTYKTKKKKLV